MLKKETECELKMEASRRAKAVIVVTVMILVIFVGIPLVRTHFHYESRYPSGSSRHVSLSLTQLDITSTNVSISFIEDPTLMYSIDVVQSEPGYHHYFYMQEAPWDSSLYDVSLSGAGGTVGQRISSINVLLGTGTYYEIHADGYMMNLTITFSHGAEMAGQEVVAHCGGGTFRLVFTEDVNFTDSGLDVQTGGATNLFLDIDLPSGMNGRISVPYQSDFAYSEMIGWSLTSSGFGNPSIFSTSSTTQPILDIFHDSIGWVRAHLND